MPGKDDSKSAFDPEADFFGEDVDWLDDDDSEVIERKDRRKRPVTPPPPPSFEGASVLPREHARVEWERRNLPFGSELSSVDTLIAEPLGPDLGDFGSVDLPADQGPTLVAEDDPTASLTEAERASLDEVRARMPGPRPSEVPTAITSRAELDDLAGFEDFDDPDDEIPEESGPIVPIMRPPPEPSPVADEAEPGEAVVEDGADDTPLVQTKEPAPIRMELPEKQAGSTPSFTSWSQPRATLPPFLADGDNDARMQTATLITEASVAQAEDRGELLFRAGWTFRHRLGDLQGAEALYRDALTSTCRNPTLYRELADVGIQLGRWEEAAVTLHERATLLDGLRAAESLRESSVIHLHRLQAPGDGVGRLWDSLGANEEDYASLVMLRDVLSDVQPERADVLARIANLAGGAIAAEAWCERGRSLRGLEPEEAVRSYEAALVNQPDHVGAFVALEQIFDSLDAPERKAALYMAEAKRVPASAGWWSLLAARAFVEAGDHERADAAYTRAAAEGWGFAAEERAGRLLAAEAWTPLERDLVRSVSRQEGLEAATTWFRIGWIRERHLKSSEAALAAYREALGLAPEARPVLDAIRRVLFVRRDAAGQAELAAGLLEHASEDEKGALYFRLAEAREEAGDLTGAREAFEASLAAEPDQWPARAGLTRVLRALADDEALVAAYLDRAERVGSPELKAHFLYSAATLHTVAGPDAFGLLLRALEQQPGHLPALELLGASCSTAEQSSAYARALGDAAATIADTDVRVHLHYQAGRVHAARTGDYEAARRALSSCLELVQSFAPARELAFDLAVLDGDAEAVVSTYRAEAEEAVSPAERAWLLYAAAVIGDPRRRRTDLDAVLAHQPDHAGALRLVRDVCVATGDLLPRIEQHRAELVGPPSVSSARVAVRLAQLLLENGQSEEAASVLTDLATMDVPERPLEPAARLARHAAGIRAETALLTEIDSPWARVARAELLVRRRRDRDVARELAESVLGDQPSHLGAALVLSRVGAFSDDLRLMARAQAVVARYGEGRAMRFANAMWAASSYEGFEDVEAALELYEMALDLFPGSESAALAVLRCLVALGKVDGVVELAERDDLDTLTVAVALLQLDELEGAERLLRQAADQKPALPALLELEALLERQERWEDVHAVVLRRLAVSHDEMQKESIEHKRRWILAEKLPESEEAWTVYQALHESEPDDRRITEALARIAGARKETAMAIGLLTELASTAATPEESARYKRRVAEAHLSAGNRGAARQAYLDALDYAPSDQASLDGLKKMAHAEEDWAGLVQILEREIGLASADRVLELRREIATVQEESIGNGPIAIEAWRAVLEIAPQDTEALDHLLGLTTEEKAWPLFVEMANVRAALSGGAERTGLLRRIGEVSLDELKRDDGIRYFERAISEEPPDYVAAQRLEQIYRSRGDWKGVSRSLEVQGRSGPTSEERISALEKAAILELETRHDRDAAAVVYNRILEIEPDHEPALRFMASHLFESGRFDEALPVCQRLEPVVEKGQDLDDFDTRMELAQFYFYFAEMLRLAEEDGALERYERALELNATHLASLEAVGPLLCKAEKWKKAEMVYRQLLQLSGGQGERHKVASTYTQLGLVERALGRSEKARKRFHKALEIYPNHVEALKGMAKLLEDREDWSNLLNIYNNVIYHASVAEDVIAGYMTKGRVLDDHMARPDKAAQHYQRSLDFKADQPFAYLRLAELAMRRDDYETAGQLVGKALKVDSEETDEVRALLLLVQAASRTAAGRTTEAGELVEQAGAQPGGDDIPPTILSDLEMLRQFVKQRLPAT